MKPLWLRIILWCFSHISYRLAVERPDRLPDQGGALLVSNHQSFVDMLLILASTRRFVRFVLPEEICQRRWLAPWLRLLKAIPLTRGKPAQRNGCGLESRFGCHSQTVKWWVSLQRNPFPASAFCFRSMTSLNAS